jgi:plastocyanin
VALTLMVAAVTGCANQPTMEEPVSQDQTSEGMMVEMACPMCNEGPPAVETGTATEEDGVQVVRITQKDGYYSPNEITLKAGTPAKLIFTGDAKDCSGKPKIAELNKQADFTQTGEATMDLGTVSSGTYKITCGMDNDGGSIIVQ